MTSRFSSPLNSLGNSKSAIYRPKYKTKTVSPTYSLDKPVNIKHESDIGLIEALQSLEEWSASEELEDKSKIARWRNEKLKTLSLCILSPPKKDWDKIILKACKEWEYSSGGIIQFVTTTHYEKADICLNWSDTPIKGRDFEVGHTNCQIKLSRWITKATITLLTEPVIDKSLSTGKIKERLYTTVLHELGHAMGLEHSNLSKDVMHHQGWQNRHLSSNDIKRLKDLYINNTSMLFWI